MRTLHIVESLAAGGVETTFLNVLRSFPEAAAKGGATYEHDVLAFEGGPLEPGYREAARTLFITSASADIARLLADGYDAVHVVFERCAHRVAPYLVAGGGPPIVYAKGYDLAGMFRIDEGFDWSAEESLMAACDAVTFTTPQLAARYDVPSGRATILRKAFAFDKFAHVSDPGPDVPNRILCVANLHPQKRVWDLVPMLRALRRQVPDASVQVVGAGAADAVDRLRAAAAKAGVADAFCYAGQTLDVAAALAGSRVFVLPSEAEGVPTVLLEAMAAGRPVIATRVGHVESIVDDGGEGFLVAPRDIPAMASRAAQLLSDRDLAARLGARGRIRAATHDVRIVAADLLEVLISVTRREPRAAGHEAA